MSFDSLINVKMLEAENFDRAVKIYEQHAGEFLVPDKIISIAQGESIEAKSGPEGRYWSRLSLISV